MTVSRVTLSPEPVLDRTDQTPTVSEFLNAAHSEYTRYHHPANLRPFQLRGQQMRHKGDWSGLAARVWKTPSDQVVVAYQGTTGGDNAFMHPVVAIAQLAADIQIVASRTPPMAAKRAAEFAEHVVEAAADQDIAREDVFLTGHSLGGIEAEYAAEQTGLGGMSFEATGIPHGGNPNNFVNIVTCGDPVASYASDVEGVQPFAPPYEPDKSGILPHYGPVVMVGDPANQDRLKKAISTWNNGPIAKAMCIKRATELTLTYHMPVTQAHALGVKLTQSPVVACMDLLGDRSGPVVQAADDTIPQFLERARTDDTLVMRQV